jgi:CubicO group peptidase (beta-lactamase class C family)
VRNKTEALHATVCLVASALLSGNGHLPPPGAPLAPVTERVDALVQLLNHTSGLPGDCRKPARSKEDLRTPGIRT